MSLNKDKLKKEIRKSCITIAICILIYVVSFIINSFFGGYWLVPEMDGRDRLGGFWSLHTAVMWQPRFGHEAMGHLDYLGALYTPLIRFDRKLIHPTIYISDDEGEKKISNLKVSEVHPHWRDEFLTTVMVTAIGDESEKVLRCTFRYTGSDHPRDIAEIKIRKELAKTLDVSPPSGFVEKIFKSYEKYDQEHYVCWVGKLSLPKDQDAILTIPAKQPQAGKGRIIFYYQRTDDVSHDFENLCSVELR
jgi:hypothetical protein